MILAGTFAEARVSKRSARSVFLAGGADDYAVAIKMVEWLSVKGYAHSRTHAWERAKGTTPKILFAANGLPLQESHLP